MYVADIYSELTGGDVLGVCKQDEVFRRLTDAVRLISNQGILDPAIGEMSLCVCDGCVTLPADVMTVLAVNQAGYPTLLRDEWFRYHANGPGDVDFIPWSYTNVLGGNFCTYKDPSGPVALVAQVESPLDSNKKLRVFGWDENGKRIYTTDADGNLQDGMLVPTVYGFSEPNPSAPLIARFDRIQKDLTNGFVKLLAVNADGSPHTQIGYYLPNETNPQYTRVRVGDQNWITIKYKKRDFEVRSMNDWVNVDNREVLILAVKAVNARRKNNMDLARTLEAESSRILAQDAAARRPPSANEPQVIWNEGIPAGELDRLFY